MSNGSASNNEKQKLTINAVATGGLLDDTLRLAFPDSNGSLQFTTPIAYNANADTIKTALEALSGIGVGNVAVTGQDGVFEIEFKGTLATKNVALLTSDATELAGAFSLDFGESLGDFANFDTDGTFTIAANLMAGLTFGLDLDPNEPITLTSPVSTTTVNVTVNAKEGSSDNKVQILTVENA